MRFDFQWIEEDSQLLPFLNDPVLSGAAIYWVAKCSSRPMPDRRDIDPTDMPRQILPFLSLIEWSGPGDVFRFRLCGTDTASRFSRDPTGKTSEQIFTGEYRICIESLCRTVRETRSAVYAVSKFTYEDDGDISGMLQTRRLLMPLSCGGTGVARVLIAQTWPTDSNEIVQEHGYEITIRTADMEQHLAKLINIRGGLAQTNLLST